MGRGDCCNARWGTSFESKRWITLDPCGLFCVTCSLGVHVYASTIIGLKLIGGSMFLQVFYGAIYMPITLLAVWSLFKAWRTDPGSVPMGARPLTTVKRAGSSNTENRAIRRCHKCNDNFKPPRAHHDSVTGRCVVKFDHFCPWVGNAVGALNHKFFVLFIGYTMVTCILTLMFLLVRVILCGTVVPVDAEGDESAKEEDWSEPENKKADPSRWLEETVYKYPECNDLISVFVILLAVVAVAFLVFTCCMLVEQIEAIESNTSKIARMKLKVGQGGTELERVSHDFNEMFGGSSPKASWHWFLPLDVKFPSGMEKVVLGYEWDPTFGDEPFQEDDMVAAIKGEKTEQNDDKEDRQDDVDLEANEATSEMSDTSSTADTSSSDSFHVVGAKKRNKSKKTEDNPTFVDGTKNRLT